jgi:hypothetical protein
MRILSFTFPSLKTPHCNPAEILLLTTLSSVLILIATQMVLHAQIASLDSVFAEQKFATYTVKGKPAGLYKNAGTFSYLWVFGAGHEVAAYL